MGLPFDKIDDSIPEGGRDVCVEADILLTTDERKDDLGRLQLPIPSQQGADVFQHGFLSFRVGKSQTGKVFCQRGRRGIVGFQRSHCTDVDRGRLRMSRSVCGGGRGELARNFLLEDDFSNNIFLDDGRVTFEIPS